ncbi:MAG: glycosyltransferase, partial [Candidatus Thorarchaeota archaeon]
HPSVLLLIAGSPWGEDGEFYLLEIRELIERLGVSEWVRLDTEFIPSERVPLYFAAAAVILLPYEESVGASGPAHHCAAYGVPIVAADVGLHMREALGGYVVLFKSKDATDLAHKILELLDDPAWRTRIGEGLREYATHEDWARAAARTVAHYARTLTL